jgi:hypothetical protein
VQRTVIATHNNIQYKVDDIDFKSNPKTYKFKLNDQTISMFDYFKKQYNITLKDAGQPLLLEFKKGGQTVALPPELCILNGLPDAMLADFRVQQALTPFKQKPPSEKLMGIDNLKDDLVRGKDS